MSGQPPSAVRTSEARQSAGSITNSEEMYSEYNLAGQSLWDDDSVWNRSLSSVKVR
jgi:hypothetical protein